MLIFRYKALFGLLFAVILNCETASLFGGGTAGASGEWTRCFVTWVERRAVDQE